jgi:hypothetical protein
VLLPPARLLRGSLDLITKAIQLGRRVFSTLELAEPRTKAMPVDQHGSLDLLRQLVEQLRDPANLRGHGGEL